jgi:hypothetical protein
MSGLEKSGENVQRVEKEILVEAHVVKAGIRGYITQKRLP